MKKRLVIVLLILLVMFSVSARGSKESDTAVIETETPELPAPETLEEKISYALGYMHADSYKSQGIILNPLYFAEAMDVVMNDGEARYTLEEMNEFLMEYQEAMMADQQAEMEEAAGSNLEKAESFLEENKDREGVETTLSGLQYEVLAEGDGPNPTAADTVTVHYSGTLLSGEVFDSSYQRGTPATFPLSNVIAGWTEGVQLMSVGSSYRFFIHPDLGYGEMGAGDMIGPNELLIFDVELISIDTE